MFDNVQCLNNINFCYVWVNVYFFLIQTLVSKSKDSK